MLTIAGMAALLVYASRTSVTICSTAARACDSEASWFIVISLFDPAMLSIAASGPTRIPSRASETVSSMIGEAFRGRCCPLQPAHDASRPCHGHAPEIELVIAVADGAASTVCEVSVLLVAPETALML